MRPTYKKIYRPEGTIEIWYDGKFPLHSRSVSYEYIAALKKMISEELFEAAMNEVQRSIETSFTPTQGPSLLGGIPWPSTPARKAS